MCRTSHLLHRTFLSVVTMAYRGHKIERPEHTAPRQTVYTCTHAIPLSVRAILREKSGLASKRPPFPFPLSMGIDSKPRI